MPIKYIPYHPSTVRGQAILGEGSIQRFHKLKYQNQMDANSFIQRGIPFFETDVVETVGKDENQNLVIQGDCLNAIAYLKENNIKIDLVYIDPPFASNANYSKKIYLRKNPKLAAKLSELDTKLKAEGTEVDNSDLQSFEENMYGDIWQKEDYLNWIYERLLAIRDVMSDTASIYVHLDWHIGHYVKIIMDEIFGEENLINEIIWSYTGNSVPTKSFQKKHDSIFLYSRNEDYLLNLDSVLVPYKQSTLDRYNHTDENGKKYKISSLAKGSKEIVFAKDGQVLNDVWEIPILRKIEEKVDYSTQKPEALLERIIKASSNEGMIVADFFGGSGVTAKVAHDLGRRFVTSDVNINSIQTIRDRLMNAGASFSVLKVRDGVDLYRNPVQTMSKLATLLPNLNTSHEFGSFWFGSMPDKSGNQCPVWVPDLKGMQRVFTTGTMKSIIMNTPDESIVVIIYYVAMNDEKAIKSAIKEYDKRNSESGKPVEYEFRALSTVLDDVIVDDTVECEVTKDGDKFKIDFTRFYSDTIEKRLHEYNSKTVLGNKKNVQDNLLVEESNEEVASKIKSKFVPIEISDIGLELIEMVEVGTLKNDIWSAITTLKIDKYGFVELDGAKTKKFWDGSLTVDAEPEFIKIRNIVGDEVVISVK
jgi:adenine-specific DNA-methyltransferase